MNDDEVVAVIDAGGRANIGMALSESAGAVPETSRTNLKFDEFA